MSDLRDDLLLTLCQPNCGLRIDWERPCPQHARQAESLEAVVQKWAEQLATKWELEPRGYGGYPEATAYEDGKMHQREACADELREAFFGLATREESNHG